jgi:mRNA interferase YafQ
MKKPIFTRQFERDIRRMQKRGKDLQKMKTLIERLLSGTPLNPRRHDHGLIGPFKGRRECHIEPDWLLIYKSTGDEVVLERTGNHTDLFE